MNETCEFQRTKITALASAFSTVQTIYVYKDLESNFLYANPYCINFLGYKNEEQIIGKNDYDFFWCDYADLYKKEEADVIQQGSYASLVPSIDSQGEEVLFFSTRELFLDHNKTPIGILCQAKPIHDKKILELSNLLNTDSKSNKKIISCEKPLALPEKLTKREREFLFFLLRGYSAKMIANTFFVTERAVEAHVERLKQKFDVNSKHELVAKAIHLGLLYDIPKSLLNKCLNPFLTDYPEK